MATVQGIWNQAAQSNAATLNAKPTANATSSSSSSGSDVATISSNDFLTLLVTEMKNQDPTATTDPNEYINQLVSVNSLEQLISINQTLSSAVGTSSSTSTTSGAQSSGASTTPVSAQAAAGAKTALQMTPATAGNLSVPQSSNAAQRVASALNGSHK